MRESLKDPHTLGKKVIYLFIYRINYVTVSNHPWLPEFESLMWFIWSTFCPFISFQYLFEAFIEFDCPIVICMSNLLIKVGNGRNFVPSNFIIFAYMPPTFVKYLADHISIRWQNKFNQISRLPFCSWLSLTFSTRTYYRVPFQS